MLSVIVAAGLAFGMPAVAPANAVDTPDPATASISGTIRGAADGGGTTVLPGGIAYAHLYEVVGGVFSEHAILQVPDSGDFTFGYLLPGTYTVSVTSDNTQTDWNGIPVNGVPGLGTLPTYTLATGEAHAAGALVLPLRPSVSGIVYGLSPTGKIPLKGALVETQGLMSYRQAVTDETGRYTLKHVASGDVTLRAHYTDASSAISFQNGESAVIPAGTESLDNVDITLKAGSAINGTLTKRVGGVVTAATGLDVAVYDALTGANVGWGHSDSNGRYSAPAPRAGAYKVSFGVYASSTGLIPEYFDNASDLASAKTIPVAGETTVLGIDAELSDVAVVPPVVTDPPVDPTNPPVDPGKPTNTTADSTSKIEIGGMIAVSGDGFQPFEKVKIWLHSEPVLLGTLTADAQGHIRGSLAIPADTPAGTHHLVMVDSSSVSVVSGSIAISAPAAATPITPSSTTTATPTASSTTATAVVKKSVKPASVLASTGTDVSGAWFGIAFLLLGGLALTVGARARQRSDLKSN